MTLDTGHSSHLALFVDHTILIELLQSIGLSASALN